MRTVYALIIVASLVGVASVGVCQSTGKTQVPNHDMIRAFAQEELDGPYVKCESPMKEIKRNVVLLFQLGKVDTGPFINRPIAYQFHLELLRKHAFFGNELTGKAITDMEEIIMKMMKNSDGIDYDEQLRTVMIDYVIRYAASKKLLVTPEFGFREKQYYISFELIDKDKVTFEKLRQEVERYFDKDAVAYRAPTTAKGRGFDEREVIYFDSGDVMNCTPERYAVNYLFHFELMKRKPNIDRVTFERHTDRIMSSIRSQFDKERKAKRYPWEFQGPPFANVMEAAYKDSAELKNMAFGIYAPPNEQVWRPYVLQKGITIRTEKNAKRVAVIPALAYRFAVKARAEVSAIDVRFVKAGEERELRAGKYVYQIEYADGKRSGFRAFSVPDSVNKKGELNLE